MAWRPDTSHRVTIKSRDIQSNQPAGRNRGEIFRPSCHEAEKFSPRMLVVRHGEGKGRHHRVPGRRPTAQGARSLTTGPPSANLTQDAQPPLYTGRSPP